MSLQCRKGLLQFLIAGRLESHGAPGRVQVSDTVFQRLQSQFDFEPRGIIELKGRGPVQTYFLNSQRA
jgi:adenylate cyclase